MRNGQNKRMRGRNRKGQNPLTRVYESNGPDVKIRGTASHVADKYIQLARDAQTSGDPVAAEPGPSTTDCVGLTVALPAGSGGSWEVSVAYTSSATELTSDTMEVQVP